MVRRRGENLHSVYILLFLNIAFFILEYQDPQRFALLFSFDKAHFLQGQVWRVITYQFSQAGQGWAFLPMYVILFLRLCMLYFMGAAVEEAWGTYNFLIFYGISTVATAATAAALGIGLLGGFFVTFTLLFVFAALFPEQVLLLIFIPVRVRWLAYFSAGILLLGAFTGGAANVAAVAGSMAGYVYFLLSRTPAVPAFAAAGGLKPPPKTHDESSPAVLNAARFVAIKRAIAAGAVPEIERLAAQSERDIVHGVNICPPADYKPESLDGYCIRCEGFSECSARHLRAAVPKGTATDAGVPEPTV
jgi:membrane associated rhomboid family serine protease